MKNFRISLKKNGKGQVLVLVAISLLLLVALIGLAIDTGYMYVSYARLHRAVDAAALGGTGEFKRNYSTAELIAAAEQVLYMNLNGDQTAGSSEFPVLEINTCDTVAADHGIARDQIKANLSFLISVDVDPKVCTDPLKKIVRVKVQQNVPTFFLSIIGITSYPIVITSLAEAATVDVVMTIDTSESMAKGWPGAGRSGDDADPSQCNIYNSCYPFWDVKNAAKLFLDNLYFPYDRVAIVTFAKDAYMEIPMSDDYTNIRNAIDNLTVFEGNQSCPYRLEDRPLAEENYAADDDIAINPCRLYDNGGNYLYFDCPNFYGLTPDASGCPSTNTADGVALAGSIVTGDYSSTSLPAANWPDKRDEALWVVLLLTDGAANSGHDNAGNRLCPNAERGYEWIRDGHHAACRDNDTLTRHCWDSSAASQDCINAKFPQPAAPLFIQSIVDQDLYDADDRARDMFDQVSRNDTLIFTIGMGAQTTANSMPNVDVNGIAPGTTLLQYGAYGTTNDMTNGNALLGLSYYGDDPVGLTRIFLAIANNLATRINQ